MLCAALELRILGYEISEHYIEQLKNIEVQKQKLKEYKKRMKEEQHQDDMLEYLDETFYFIAGYTSNNVPYEVTWDEMNHGTEELDPHNCSEELPFTLC